MATASLTDTMAAQAQALLVRAERWTKVYDPNGNVKGYSFASSRTLADGTPIYHMTRQDSLGCTCRSHQFRGQCSHVEAVRQFNERRQRAERAARPRRTYAVVYGFCEARGCQEDRLAGESYCAAHQLADSF